jgi:hypothetical protein
MFGSSHEQSPPKSDRPKYGIRLLKSMDVLSSVMAQAEIARHQSNTAAIRRSNLMLHPITRFAIFQGKRQVASQPAI